MRQVSTDSLCLCLRIAIAVIVLAACGCSRKEEPPPPAESGVAPVPSTRATERSSLGEIAGVPYLEHMTGGARSDERVPMIVALHPMGGDPADLWQLFRRYPRRARFILPYGHPNGGMFVWYDSVREDVPARVVAQETDRIATAVAALVYARPTVGKPLLTGFSQGGMMTFALVVTHPEAFAAAFPIGGFLPPSLYPSAALSSVPRPATLPSVVAFHGALDLAVPTQGARDSIAELKRAGYIAELREYAGVEHDISAEELAEVFERIGRVAESVAAGSSGP